MIRLTDRLDMTIAVDWDEKPLTKQTNKNLLLKLSLDYTETCWETSRQHPSRHMLSKQRSINVNVTS